MEELHVWNVGEKNTMRRLHTLKEQSCWRFP